MTRQVVLLRVGIDAGCGGIQGPLFGDGTFEFMCIPDNKGVTVHTYGNMVGRNGTTHVSYFPESRRKLMATQTVHVDPDPCGTCNPVTSSFSIVACNRGTLRRVGMENGDPPYIWPDTLNWPSPAWRATSTRIR